MTGNSFYDLLMYDTHIDNPDGRITQDIENYGETSIKVIVAAAQSPLIIAYYSYSTFKDMGLNSLLITLLFTTVSFFATRFAMSPIVRLTYKFEAANADFRTAHVNLKENAETIALSRGQSAEEKLLSDRLASVLSVQKQLSNTSIILNIVVNICQYFGNALVYLCIYICAPATEDPSILAEFTGRVSFEVIMLISGITSLMNVINDFSKLSGYSTRIQELLSILREQAEHVNINKFGNSFVLENATVMRPSGDSLINDLNLTVRPGESLFIVGPSGAGKSSLFRVLGGIWPIKSGKVTIPEEKTMILTQRPYVPRNATLEEAIAFPKELNEVDLFEIQNTLRLLKIEHLKLRDDEDWWVGLSPGEQQRVAIARILVHRPTFALLDEATSAIPSKLEEEIFKVLAQKDITCITIAHNKELRKWHKNVLELTGNGRYSIY